MLARGLFRQVNYLGAVHVLETALDAGARRVLHTSTESILTRSRQDAPIREDQVVPDDDARAQPFRLTPQGKRLIEKAVPAWEQAQRQATELLGSEGVAQLDRAAKKLRQARPEA